MLIPLDYYRVLGIPTQVTQEQLKQAYEDRRMQLPRREYSDEAIASRQRLLEKAYEVLSDEQKRSEYDQQFQALESSESDPVIPSSETEGSEESSPDLMIPEIEIASDEQVGALIILSELGEYEQVIKVADNLLESDPPKTQSDVLADIRLSLALAHLELSREHWQRNYYEKAAQAGHQALEALSRSSNFVKIKEEITKELNLLRPYRILELLAQPEALSNSRQQGLKLLKNLLDERQGIEGQGADHSGLNVDNFLRFIQQLRSYLTLQEQLNLFTTEAERPSLVATYLAVYTLIAQGVWKKDPHAIVQASQLLEVLHKHQDVSLEKAICALLLGQTKAANEALQQSQDRESLDFIRQQSQGSPDLLPGLYVYSKQWLETEVFSHFRDLAHQSASLTEYFADETVVSYLETYLEDHPQPILETHLENTPDKQAVGVAMASALSQNYPSRPPRRSQRRRTARSAHYTNGSTGSSAPSGSTATATLPVTGTRPHAYRPKPQPSERSEDVPPKVRRRPAKTVKVGEANIPLRRKKKVRRKQKLKIKPLLFLVGAVGGLGLLGLGVRMMRSPESPVSELESNAVLVQLNQPIVEIPAENARIILPTGALTSEGAKDIIETWLVSKAKAFGADHQIEEINTILTDSLANIWQNRARVLKNAQSYWTYQHQVQVNSLNSEENGNRALVNAQVKETANLYERGRLNPNRSYEEVLQVRYTLAKEEGQWMIDRIEVLP